MAPTTVVFFFVFIASSLALPKGGTDCSCQCKCKTTACSREYWTKITGNTPVCFAAKNDNFASVYPATDGFAAAIKLVHRSGKVHCDSLNSNGNWGCQGRQGTGQLNVILTGSDNKRLAPDPYKVTMSYREMWYDLPGFQANSSSLILDLQGGFDSPHLITPDTELRLWFGEDLKNVADDISELDGQVCVDVFARFV